MLTPIYQIWQEKNGSVKEEEGDVFDAQWLLETRSLLSLLPYELSSLKSKFFGSFEHLLILICRLSEQGVWYDIDLSLADQSFHGCSTMAELIFLCLDLKSAWKGKMIVTIKPCKTSTDCLKVRLAVTVF